MKPMNPLKVVAGALVFVAAHLQAQNLAYNYSSTLTANESVAPITGGPSDMGNVFYVNSSISVNQLGVFSSGANATPFSGAQGVNVSIFSITVTPMPYTEIMDSGTLVSGATATFNQSNPGTLATGTSTLVQTITPVSLSPGLYMVAVNNFGSQTAGNVGSNSWAALPYYDNNYTPVNSATVNTFGGYVSFDGSFEDDNNDDLLSFDDATIPDSSQWGYYSVGSYNSPRFADANFGIVAVPEPGVLEIGAVVLVVLFACVSRYKKHSKRA
jgi:hypothetical protein